MEKFKVSFSADNQQLKALGTKHASDTYADIEATFVLGDRWTDMDSVSAVWWNDFTRVATVLDSQGKCIVPHEVLTRKGCVRVNLVGSIVEGDELVTRLTSYSAEAVQVNEKIKLTGSETSEITPSQYEQFVANVKADADRAEAGADEAEQSAQSASESATASANSASDSAQSATASEGYAQNASESAISAENAKDDAENARDEILSMRATAETLAEGSQATASYSDGVLTLGIPRGDTGARGAKGDTGATPNLTIGTVETLEPTESATATITGTAENPVLNLGLPQGRTGEVSQAELDEAITDLKSDIKTNLAKTVIDFSGGTVGKYVTSGGSVKSASFCTISAPIPLKMGDKLSVRCCAGNTMSVIAQLKSNGAYIPIVVGEDDSNVKTYSFTAVGDQNIVISYYHGDGISGEVYFVPSKPFDNLINSTATKLSFSGGTDGKYVNSSGNVGTANWATISAPISMKKGEKISVSCNAETTMSAIAQKKPNGTYSSLVVGSDNSHVANYEYTATEDMDVVISYTTSWGIDGVLFDGLTRSNILSRLDLDYSSVISRVLCVGDSLTAGASYFELNQSAGDNAKAYPYFLSKEMNIECVNAGKSGATVTAWMSSMYANYNFADYDCMIVWLGTNGGLTDTIETDVDPYDDYNNYANTNTGQYCRIVEEFIDKSNGGHVALCLLSWWDGADGITNEVIQKIATKYGCQLINTDELKNSVNPSLHWPNNSLHFNTYGNMYIAHKYHNALREYWKEHISDMDFSFKTRGNGLHWWMTH